MKVLLDNSWAFILLIALGCGGGNGGDTDSSTDTAVDQPSTCRQDPDPLNPHYRMVMLNLTSPDRLDNVTLEINIIKQALDLETFLWLIRFSGVDDGTTDTDGTMSFETGAGLVEDVDHHGCYQLWNNPDYPNVTGTLDISGDDFSWPASEPSFSIDVPIFWWDYERFLFEMPLKDVRITSGSFSASRDMIGTYSAGEWTCGANITGMITVADAREVYIDDMTQYLCAVLSGAVGDPTDSSDDCEGDPSTWPSPPDTEYEGEPAYSMSGCFAAEQVIVVD